jgi:hypothetical protein
MNIKNINYFFLINYITISIKKLNMEGKGLSKKTKGALETGFGSWGALSSGLQSMGHAMKFASNPSTNAYNLIPALFYAGISGLSSYGISKGIKHLKGKSGKGLVTHQIKNVVKHMKKDPLDKKIHVNDLHKIIGHDNHTKKY